MSKIDQLKKIAERLSSEDMDELVHDLKSGEASEINNLSSEDQDEMVHDTKSGEASEINNGGKEAQISFLLDVLGEKDAQKAIKGLLS